MRKLIVSTWMTIDGVFDATNMHQWFNPYDSTERQEYIRSGILDADAIIFGRKTYEMLAPYWSSLTNNEMGVAGKLNSVQKYVVSKNMETASWNNTVVIKDDVVEAIRQLKQQPGNEMQIEGSAELVQSLSGAGVIDEYRFLVHPVVMGSGKRFFNEGMSTGNMELVRTTAFNKGVLLLCYRPLSV